MKLLRQNLFVTLVVLVAVATVAQVSSRSGTQGVPKPGASTCVASPAGTVAPAGAASKTAVAFNTFAVEDIAAAQAHQLYGPRYNVPAEAVGPSECDAPRGAMVRTVRIESNRLLVEGYGSRSTIAIPPGGSPEKQAYQGNVRFRNHATNSEVHLRALPDHRGLMVEAVGADGLKQLPSLAPLLTDAKLWDHRDLNQIRYYLDRGNLDQRNYSIRGAFVGKDQAIYVVVTWYDYPHGNPELYVMARLELRASGWQVTPLFAAGCPYDGLPILIAFRNRFLVVDGPATTWFDPSGRSIRRLHVKTQLGDVTGVVYRDGMLAVLGFDRIVCVDAWTGRELAHFATPGR